MTAAVQAVLEQAKQLTEKERAELVEALTADDGPWPPPITREELDRQIAESQAEARRGEFVDESEVLAELDAL